MSHNLFAHYLSFLTNDIVTTVLSKHNLSYQTLYLQDINKIQHNHSIAHCQRNVKGVIYGR